MSKSSSVQLLSCVRLCDPMDCSTPGFPVHHQLPELAQTHVLLPSILPSIRVFSNEPVLHIRWPKHWSYIFIYEVLTKDKWVTTVGWLLKFLLKLIFKTSSLILWRELYLVSEAGNERENIIKSEEQRFVSCEKGSLNFCFMWKRLILYLLILCTN